jgi:UDP-glucose 4-epimerase
MGALRIAITGSRGFIGSRLTRAVKTAGFKVLELDIKTGVDLVDYTQLKKIPRFDCLIHLAAKSFVPASYKDPLDFYSNNYLSTLNALELCRNFDAKFIFTSSYVYGHPGYLPIDENHPVQAFNPYSDTKLIGEKLCRSYHDFFGVNTIIVRPFNAYGPGQNSNFLIPRILEQIKNKQIKLQNPKPKRDFVYVDDLVNFFVLAINYEKTPYEVFNVGSGTSFSVRQIVDIILGKLERDIPVEFDNIQRENEIMDTRADISKAWNMLKWSPQTDFEEGIFLTLKAAKLL